MTVTRVKGAGWTAFRRDDHWVLKFKAAREWRQHRVPARVQDEDQLRRYVVAFLKAEADLHGASARPMPTIRKDMTIGDLATLWTSGELARLYPDHVRKKRSFRSDRGRLAKYILPLVGDRPVADFAGENGLELADRVMHKLPPVEVLSRDSRRQVAQILHRLMALAVYPLRLLPANPLPRGWLPRGSPPKAKSYLYPVEDAQLLACTKVPLLNRIFYGFLAREGLRASEGRDLLLRDVDLVHGLCNLDANKTDDPRAWALSPGVLAALRRYLAVYRPATQPSELLFADPQGRRPPGDNLGRALRRDLQRAGVKRPQLFVDNAERKHIRGHDLRATFVTIHLANGRNEAWIADRTGHKSSQMISRYRRLARSHSELHMGELTSLVEAIPELAGRSVPQGEPERNAAHADKLAKVDGGPETTAGTADQDSQDHGASAPLKSHRSPIDQSP